MKVRRRKKQSGLKILLWKIIEVTLQHPFTYAKVLIQIGYEPYQPKPENILGLSYLALPNVFQYVDYIASVDGWLGCFRGLVPNICCTIVNYLVTKIMMRTYYDNAFSPKRTKSVKSHQLAIEQGPHQFQSMRNVKPKLHNRDESPDVSFVVKQTGLKLICMTYGVFASHPFYVIMVRSMGEFVGRENKYTSLRASIAEVYKHHGSAGYFRGVVARLLAEYLKVVAPVIGVLLVSKLRNRNNWLAERVAGKTASLLASRWANKLYVVTNNRAVSKSGLMIGQPPYTPLYQNSLDCWLGLANLNQLDRGYFKVFRTYKGPTILEDGKHVPDKILFGPDHTPKY